MGYASATPEIMISAVANATSTIRVGSGGVMLNHYSPFKVAETFTTLKALYGDRIDLGIGRASGANFLATYALNSSRSNDYEQKASYLAHFLNGTLPKKDYLYGVQLTPQNISAPPMYILGSSDGSSALASYLGVGFCLALFIGTHDRPTDIVKEYKRNFRPSIHLKKPKAMLALACICAPSTQEAKYIASSHTYWKLQAFRHSQRESFKHPDEVQEIYPTLSKSDQLYYDETLNTMVVGTPKECKEKLQQVAKNYEADEVVVVNVTHSFKDRLRSYELLAKEFLLTTHKGKP